MLDGSPSHISHVLGSRLVRTTFSGHGAVEDSLRGAEEFKQLIDGMDDPIWICDCTGLISFDVAGISVGPRWFGPFRARGGHHVFVATANPLVKIAATTAGLTGRAHVRCFPTLAAAEAAAREQLAAPVARAAAR